MVPAVRSGGSFMDTLSKSVTRPKKGMEAQEQTGAYLVCEALVGAGQRPLELAKAPGSCVMLPGAGESCW